MTTTTTVQEEISQAAAIEQELASRVSEAASEPESEPAKPEEPAVDEKAEREKRIQEELFSLLDDMQLARDEFEEMSDRIDTLKEEMKEARASKELAAQRLVRLTAKIREVRSGKSLKKKKPLVVECEADDETEEATAAPEATAAEVNDDSWRLIPTATLLEPPIERFGAKKAEALLEAVPTLGDFVDLQCRVGKDAATLRELLPKGIGEAAADILEERLLNATRDFYAQADEGQVIQEGEATGEVAEEVEEITEEVNEDPEIYKRKIDALVDSFVDNWYDDEPAATDAEREQEGYQAYQGGNDPEACPWGTGSQEQRDWAIGWTRAYMESEEAASKAEQEATPEPATASATAEKPAISVDDL